MTTAYFICSLKGSDLILLIRSVFCSLRCSKKTPFLAGRIHTFWQLAVTCIFLLEGLGFLEIPHVTQLVSCSNQILNIFWASQLTSHDSSINWPGNVYLGGAPSSVPVTGWEFQDFWDPLQQPIYWSWWWHARWVGFRTPNASNFTHLQNILSNKSHKRTNYTNKTPTQLLKKTSKKTAELIDFWGCHFSPVKTPLQIGPLLPSLVWQVTWHNGFQLWFRRDHFGFSAFFRRPKHKKTRQVQKQKGVSTKNCFQG